MKQLAKSLLVVGAMVAAGGANAAIIDDICPLIGVDYQHVWMKGKGDYSNIFRDSFPGGTVYVGARFCECLGIELGYDWSAKRREDFSIRNSFNGVAVPAPGVTGTSSVRRTGGHIDLIGYLPVVDCLELMGVVGVGYVHPKVQITTNNAVGGAQLNNVNSALQSISGKGKAVARVRIGGNYMLTECVGIRALVGWESTSAIRVKGNAAFTGLGFNSKAFKSSTTASGGIFVKF